MIDHLPAEQVLQVIWAKIRFFYSLTFATADTMVTVTTFLSMINQDLTMPVTESGNLSSFINDLFNTCEFIIYLKIRAIICY